MDGLPSSLAIPVARHPSLGQMLPGIHSRDCLRGVIHPKMMFPCRVYTSDTK